MLVLYEEIAYNLLPTSNGIVHIEFFHVLRKKCILYLPVLLIITNIPLHLHELCWYLSERVLDVFIFTYMYYIIHIISKFIIVTLITLVITILIYFNFSLSLIY